MTIPIPADENMPREVKAKYIHGKLEPMEDLELSEGEEVTISVKRPAKSPEEVRTALRETAGGWVGLIDFDAYLKDLYESRRSSSAPVDLDR